MIFKYISVLGNIGILLWVIAMFISNGLPDDMEEILIVFLFTAVPIASLLTIDSLVKNNGDRCRKISSIWPFILFKRLALEEKKKLEKLEEEK